MKKSTTEPSDFPGYDEPLTIRSKTIILIIREVENCNKLKKNAGVSKEFAVPL